ncbi:hypothetical protein D1AOALGA4SA_2178 [Olavius algarvensis Delta 1 endosymbiont]|nr:hypothetical protein D1AOALGA4SA_2178 [Olavius algarvensis Delta 1 endosymbiont]
MKAESGKAFDCGTRISDFGLQRFKNGLRGLMGLLPQLNLLHSFSTNTFNGITAD